MYQPLGLTGFASARAHWAAYNCAMVGRWRFLLLALALAWSPCTYAESVYTVWVDVKKPAELRASLHVPSAGSRRVFVRGTRWGLASQVRDPACDGQPLQRSGKDAWIIPNGCQDIDWKIAVRNVADGQADASNCCPRSSRARSAPTVDCLGRSSTHFALALDLPQRQS